VDTFDMVASVESPLQSHPVEEEVMNSYDSDKT